MYVLYLYPENVVFSVLCCLHVIVFVSSTCCICFFCFLDMVCLRCKATNKAECDMSGVEYCPPDKQVNH